MYGQKMINGVCPDCKAVLPVLENDRSGWGVVDCKTLGCNKWFDTDKYMKAGGKLVGGIHYVQ